MVEVRRARLGVAHLLAWIAYGAATVALVTAAVRAGATLALALGLAAALVAAALGLLAAGLLVSPRGRPPAQPMPGARERALAVLAAAIALLALAGAAAVVMLGRPLGPLPTALLGLAAGVQAGAMMGAGEADAGLAPRVRPAPTLFAAAVGAGMVAAAPLVPGVDLGILLLLAAFLQLCAIGVLAAAPAKGDRQQQAPGGTAASPASESRGGPGRRLRVAALGLVALAAAGAAAIASLRPALSAIGADEPNPAGPAALTLAIGALAGPPLARLAERLLAGRQVAAVATLGGVAGLAAPIARPGASDLVAAALLGIALAASVAVLELARRSLARPAPAAPAFVALAGAAGAALAGLLLWAVPVPDVVLGAALACLIAGLGAWAPGAGLVAADARDGRRNRGRRDDAKGSSPSAPPFN